VSKSCNTEILITTWSSLNQHLGEQSVESDVLSESRIRSPQQYHFHWKPNSLVKISRRKGLTYSAALKAAVSYCSSLKYLTPLHTCTCTCSKLKCTLSYETRQEVKSFAQLWTKVPGTLIRGFIKFSCKRSVGFYSRAFLVFVMKESKKRRQKQPGKLMGKSCSQPVNLPGTRPLMNPRTDVM